MPAVLCWDSDPGRAGGGCGSGWGASESLRALTALGMR